MKNLRSTILLFILFLMVIINSGCGSSPELVYSLRDPDHSFKFDSLHKVLIIAALKDDYNRKFTENRFAARLGKAGVQSYNYFDLKELKLKKEYFINKFKEENFGGAIIISLVSGSTNIKVVEDIPTDPINYWSAYDYYTDFALNKGRLTRDETYKIQVNVYSFKNDKLIWTGLTSLVNPSSDLDEIVNNVADVVADKMKEEKFLIK